MKIGIVTYHRARNYGAQLQAAALHNALEAMGNEVYFLDYYPNYHRREYALIDWEAFRQKSLIKKIKYVFKVLKNFPAWFSRKQHFDVFTRKFIHPYCKPLSEKYDCIVYGSDQIWRQQSYIEDYNPVYFGVNKFHADKHVSYAASLSNLPQDEEEIKTFVGLLTNLAEISVREATIKEFIDKHTSLSSRVDVDPTLLFDGEYWEHHYDVKRIIDKNYILLYDLNGSEQQPTFDSGAIYKYASERGLEVVRLRGKATSMGTSCDRQVDGPLEFLSMIHYADFVFTSSYHGLIFSLLFEKQVYCSFPRDSSRAKAILKELQLSDRYLEPRSKLPQSKNIDYATVLPRIDKMRQRSLKYLKNISAGL